MQQPESGKEPLSEEEALNRLELFLKPRIEQAELGEVVNKTALEIVAELKRERQYHSE